MGEILRQQLGKGYPFPVHFAASGVHSPRSPAVTGRGTPTKARFIDEHQARCVKLGLPFKEAGSLMHDIVTILFVRHRSFCQRPLDLLLSPSTSSTTRRVVR
jgi:hypothetical protein